MWKKYRLFAVVLFSSDPTGEWKWITCENNGKTMFVPLNQRPRQHGRRTVFNDHNQQSQTNKQFDLKYKETTLALGLTNIQNKREINWNPTKNVLL